LTSFDDRLKPQSLQRHMHSEYEKYLPGHSKIVANINAEPFTVNEKGRSQKTQVLDHIIKLKRDSIKKHEGSKKEKEIKNE
jgi:hypothetical protein